MQRDGRESETGAAGKWLALAAGIAIVVLAIAHVPFVTMGYAEQDAAHTGILAAVWAQDGVFPVDLGEFVRERFRSSPAYVYTLKVLIGSGMLSRASVAGFMSVVSAACGVFVPLAAFVLLRRLRGGGEATWAVILLLASPVFFESRCYGFPALVALFAFLLAVLFFDASLSSRGIRFVRVCLATCFLVLAVTIKVDIVLLSPAFLVVGLLRTHVPSRKASLAWACVLPPVGVLGWHLFCMVSAPGAADTFQSYAWWSERWPLSGAGLADRKNLVRVVMAPGVGTAVVFVLALLACVVKRGWRAIGLAVFACVLPTLAFWGMRELNSSRHNLWLVVPAGVLVSFVLHRVVNRVWLRAILIAGICAGNYLIGPANVTWGTAPARFFRAARGNQRLFRRIDRDCVLALRQPLPNGRICFFQNSGSTWVAASAVAISERCDFHKTGQAGTGHAWEFTAVIDGETKRIWVPYARDTSRQTLERIFTEGWIAITAVRADPPYVLLRPDGKFVPWPEGASTGRR
jgi:hypothetical protein